MNTTTNTISLVDHPHGSYDYTRKIMTAYKDIFSLVKIRGLVSSKQLISRFCASTLHHLYDMCSLRQICRSDKSMES